MARREQLESMNHPASRSISLYQDFKLAIAGCYAALTMHSTGHTVTHWGES